MVSYEGVETRIFRKGKPNSGEYIGELWRFCRGRPRVGTHSMFTIICSEGGRGAGEGEKGDNNRIFLAKRGVGVKKVMCEGGWGRAKNALEYIQQLCSMRMDHALSPWWKKTEGFFYLEQNKYEKLKESCYVKGFLQQNSFYNIEQTFERNKKQKKPVPLIQEKILL